MSDAPFNTSIKRAIGMAQGQRGDACIFTVAARSFKQLCPKATLTLGLNKRYADMAPLFAQHESFDDIHLYDAYDNWPSRFDLDYLERAHCDVVFDPMPKRQNEATWWVTEHQCQNACSVYGLPYPKNGIQCSLTKWFDVPDYSNYIALNYIGAFYAGYPNQKSYSPERAAELANLIRKKGYKVIVLGDPKEPGLEGTERRELSYFESVRTMLGCKMLLGLDSGLNWAASAYSHPVLACYSNAYYGPEFVKNIQPINPNGRYLDAPQISDISLDKIEQELDNLLS